MQTATDWISRRGVVGRKIFEIRASEVARHLGLTLCVGVSGVHVFFDSSLTFDGTYNWIRSLCNVHHGYC